MNRARAVTTVLAAALGTLMMMVGPRSAAAQAADTAGPGTSAAAAVADSSHAAYTSGSGWRALRVAKWGSLAMTVATATYGVVTSLAADDHYAQMRSICDTDAGRCLARTPRGEYVDPELARLNRAADDLDRRARIGLLACQIGVAASVVLFILDLRDTGAPPNVPYEAPRIRLGVDDDRSVRIGVSVVVP